MQGAPIPSSRQTALEEFDSPSASGASYRLGGVMFCTMQSGYTL